jgi:hypothetical protein
MRFLLTLSLLIGSSAGHAEEMRALIQSSPLAGSQYYALSKFWTEIKPGDPVMR